MVWVALPSIELGHYGWHSCYDIIRNYRFVTIVIATVPTLIKI